MSSHLNFEIKYTLAFCLLNNQVLMILRKNPPNAHLWNGLGGKIEENETPVQNIQRELLEEAGIEVTVKDTDYKGIVKWNLLDKNKIGGMHLFLIHLRDLNVDKISLKSNEGNLEWKSIEWITDQSNKEVVENIPFFFPQALINPQPKLYEFFYEKSNHLIKSLTSDLSIVLIEK